MLPARIVRTFSFSFALVSAVVSCTKSEPEPESEQFSIKAKLAERASKEWRVDSLSIAIDRGRLIGKSSASVWVVAVSDFQCDDCKWWNDEVLPQLTSEFVDTGRARIAFVNMPQSSHLNAMTSAVSAACASAQGKFWETTSRIFATQNQWKDLPDARPFVDSLAIAAGADPVPLKVCSDQGRSQKLIQDDIKRSRVAGVTSVPTFIIGKRMLHGRVPLDVFRAVIDSALAGK